MATDRLIISVLMPVYNARPYVAEAVRSILTQRFGDYELILIDDGSTDGSLEILHHHARADRRVRLVSRENRGLVRTLNEGLSLARGRYVARMDADDIALPHRFERQVAALEADPALVCLGANYELMDAAGRKLTALSLPTDDQQIQARLLEGHSSICHPLAMMPRQALEQAGGYDDAYPHAEDLDLWLRLGEQGRLGNLPQVLLRYRLHDQSVSHVQREAQQESARRACEAAWKRRGITGGFDSRGPIRHGSDSASRHSALLLYGWWAFGSGEWRTAMRYGGKAILARPLDRRGWKLLSCAVLKRGRQGVNNRNDK